MLERISKSLLSQFDQHRIIVWVDPTGEMAETFDAIELPHIEKIAVANNEFSIKHRVLRESRETRFLVYRRGPRPELIDNWLLDIELGFTVFKADQVAMWRVELGLPERFDAVLAECSEFFKSSKRLDKLKASIQATDTESQLRLRMLAICTAGEGGLDAALEALLNELATDSDVGFKLVQRAGLEPFLWKQLASAYGYRTEQPSLDDLGITLFKACYKAAVGEDAGLTTDARVFFNRWKNNRNNEAAFALLSGRYAHAIGLESDLQRRSYRDLIDIDFFEAVDRAVILGLVQELASQTISGVEVPTFLKSRRKSQWYEDYADLYEAIGYAASFQQAIAQMTLGMTGLTEGIQRYASSWFKIDQLYRKFVLHTQRSAQASLMEALSEQVENHYVNTYLLRLNDAWQVQVDAAPIWEAEGITPQQRFYRRELSVYREREQRICVIISDALRYEVAEELSHKVREIDKYDANIKPILGCLPSYTQLGMAALLPGTRLEIADNDTSHTLVDGQNSSGLENRKKILSANIDSVRATAIKAEEFMGLNKDDARSLLGDHDVIYVYHNTIDAIGDKIATEDKVFEAAETAIDDITKIAKKLIANNASTVLVTADHGFIYQHRPIPESDFAHSTATGEKILFQNRRFILGHGLQPDQGLRRFTAEEAGLDGTVEMLIPKSINRLRRQGSGSRFVHGGASLQEIVVPVVTITKKRQSDTSVVEVEIIGGNRKITSNQLGVVFYQQNATSPKVQGRTLRAGIYSASETLISDRHEHQFDEASDNPRDREQTVRFLLSKEADAFNGQDVYLRLEERVDNTSHYRLYREATFRLDRRMGADFDF